MRHDDHPLLTRFERLKESVEPQRRGREFERLVADLFRAAHFRIEHSPGAAKPRETDLLARSATETYLVECKWRKTKASSADVDGLRGRLSRTPGPAIGVLVSVGGYTAKAIEEVEIHRDPPILLFGPEEVEELMRGDADLRQTLNLKGEQLLIDARAHLVSRAFPAGMPRRPNFGAPTRGRDFLATNDGPVPWISGGGEFGHLAFTLIRTLDWGIDERAFSVELDLRSLTGIGDLAWAFSELAALGWTTGEGSWSLQFAHTNWHGLGAADLLNALERRRERHAGAGRRRHAEELTYVDQCAGGFWTLTAEVDSEDGTITYAEMSLQLQGIPFDRQPLAELCRTLEVRTPIEFRVRGPLFDNGVTGVSGSLEVPPVALILHEDESNPHDRHWICGIVGRNPWFRNGVEPPVGLPRFLQTTELLICTVRSWHPVSDPHTYQMNSCRWFSASSGLSAIVDVDWPDSELPQEIRERLGVTEGAPARRPARRRKWGGRDGPLMV